jgi:4-diphosphocytidyl-2C-methyl-D-erythritol kinase
VPDPSKADGAAVVYTSSSTGTSTSDGTTVPASTIATQNGTAYTIQSTDDGRTLLMNNAGAIAVTVPSGLRQGFSVALTQLGAGQVTVTGSGATVRNSQSHTKTAAQYAVVTLFAHGTNDFLLTGDTAA